MSGRKRDQKKPQAKKRLPNGWIVVPSKTYPDRVYFHNTVTRCSTWNNPCEDGDNGEFKKTSGDTSSSEMNLSLKTRCKTSQSKKYKSQPTLYSPDRNSNIRVNNDLEDYDDQDEYFINSPKKSLSHSHLIKPSSSSSPLFLSEVNHSDSDRCSDSNNILENNEKELWVYFDSNTERSSMKKSVIFSDFQEPSTSQCSAVEKMNESAKSDIKGSSRSKKKRRKRKKKCVIDETTKNTSCKKTDKTPAQTRLLKLRKQNAEKLRAVAAKYPELGVTSVSNSISKKVQNFNVFDLEGQPESNRFSTDYIKSDTCHSTAQESDNHLDVDYSEEMDWEPSTMESDVRNINVFRQQLDKPKEISSDVFQLNSNQSSILPSKIHSWFLILDTNIFVSCLSFVKELRDATVPDLGNPVIYVPWRVLQELDHLKDSKIDAVKKNLNTNVRWAISYLNDNFKSRHPRIFGQSFEDFSKMIDVESYAPDDEILQTCIQLQKQHTDKKVMLLTNDKNLESKAIVSGVEVYSKDAFQKRYLMTDSSSKFTNPLNKAVNDERIADESLCKVKEILKEFLSIVVETEMRIAFQDDWVKLAVKKPPWSLQDVMQCLLKHWRSVFFVVFSRETQSDAELLNKRLFKTEAVTTEEVSDIVRVTQRLIVSMKKTQQMKRPYLDLIPNTMEKLSNLLRTSSPNSSAQTEISLPSTSLPSESLDTGSQFNSHERRQNETCNMDILMMQLVFKDIWDYLRNFCCSVSDMVSSSGMNANPAVHEMSLKVSQILNEVQELVATIEKTLEIYPSDVNEEHPLIVHISNFLFHGIQNMYTVYPESVPVLRDELLRRLAIFFKDFEGRSFLTSALKDFKELTLNLSRAAEYFSGQCS